MTRDLAAEWRDLLASGRGRWCPGMLRIDGRRYVSLDVPTGHLPRMYCPAGGVVNDDRADDDGEIPDFDDPATLGCLLGLVREAWGDPRLVAIYCEAVNPGQSEGWAVQCADNRLPVAGDDYPTEAAALLSALAAAPVRT